MSSSNSPGQRPPPLPGSGKYSSRAANNKVSDDESRAQRSGDPPSQPLPPLTETQVARSDAHPPNKPALPSSNTEAESSRKPGVARTSSIATVVPGQQHGHRQNTHGTPAFHNLAAFNYLAAHHSSLARFYHDQATRVTPAVFGQHLSSHGQPRNTQDDDDRYLATVTSDEYGNQVDPYLDAAALSLVGTAHGEVSTSISNSTLPLTATNALCSPSSSQTHKDMPALSKLAERAASTTGKLPPITSSPTSQPRHTVSTGKDLLQTLVEAEDLPSCAEGTDPDAASLEEDNATQAGTELDDTTTMAESPSPVTADETLTTARKSDEAEMIGNKKAARMKKIDNVTTPSGFTGVIGEIALSTLPILQDDAKASLKRQHDSKDFKSTKKLKDNLHGSVQEKNENMS